MKGLTMEPENDREVSEYDRYCAGAVGSAAAVSGCVDDGVDF
jgi:hypothetical protein